MEYAGWTILIVLVLAMANIDELLKEGVDEEGTE